MSSRSTTLLAFSDSVSNKFYEISVDDCNVVVRYGAQGTRGVSQPAKAFKSVADAQVYADKLRLEKTRKGYVIAGDAVIAPAPVGVAGEKRRAHEAGLSSAGSDAAAVPKKAAPDSSAGPSAAVAHAVTCLAYSDGGSSDKFYEVVVDGCSVTIRYGRRGTSGVSSEPKVFPSPAEAGAFAAKTLAQKRKGGYADGDDGSAKTSVVAPPASSAIKVAAPAPAAAAAPAEVPVPRAAVAPFTLGSGHMEIGQTVEVSEWLFSGG